MVVSVRTFISVDLSSIPAGAYSIFCEMLFETNENKQKRGRGWPIKNIKLNFSKETSSIKQGTWFALNLGEELENAFLQKNSVLTYFAECKSY